MSKTQPKNSRRRASDVEARRRTRRPAPPADVLHPEAIVAETVATASPPEPPATEADIVLSVPEPAFAARALPPEPARPYPSLRRAIFFDVENTSRAEHIARVIDHLAVDRLGTRTEFVAVGNWKVVGADTARLLARHGAQLVHSAPSTGVKDWSDLRIAVSAGVWIAGARPGDVLEIVSDDRAFDAVGDVAASVGIAFRRLSYRALLGGRAVEIPERAPVRAAQEPAPASGSGHRRRRGRRGRRREGAPPIAAPAPARHVAEPHPPRAIVTDGDAPSSEAHTAPHDELVAVIRDLMQGAPERGVTLDTLANALKSHGFRRTPGSPRLITRLRRIKEVSVSPTGVITLVGSGDGSAELAPTPSVPYEEPVLADEAPEPGNERMPAAPGPAPSGRRRRSRRGGRGRRGRGRGQQAAPTPT